MFKFVPDTEVPGFRVGLPDDPPGFRIAEDGSVRSPVLPPPTVPFGYDPYSNILQITAPTVRTPAGAFYQPGSGLSPTQYTGYVPVSGDSPFQDPLRQAVDGAANPYLNRRVADPSQTVRELLSNINGENVGTLVGGALGTTLG